MSIPIRFDSYEWAVAHNTMTRFVNGIRQRYTVYDARRFASHDPLGEPWEPEGYLDKCGRASRHDARSFLPHEGWRQRAPLGVAASVFAIPLSPPALDAVRALFHDREQRVVLELYNHDASPLLVLAGDTIARRPISTPDPHLSSRHPLMPDVVAATSLSRRGYSSYSHASPTIGGDMYISFHA